MYQDSCKAPGADGCGFEASAATEDEIRCKLTTLVGDKHNYSYLRNTVTR
ncbi:MAG: DUF1059 domain-containing protein [Actinomycetota bacterium]|nr:DUF1059 domain-containing protein [Actinomycetota bacterium]